MKKILAILLAATCVFGCVACGNGGNSDDGQQTVAVADAQELLTKVWDAHGEDEKFFAMGGHYENPTDGAPGAYDVSKAEDLGVSFCFPAESVSMIDDAATIMHAMNANNFSAAAYHVTDAANVETIVNGIKDNTINNQWMCGFPERLIIVTVGNDYVVSAFGAGDIMSVFESKLTEVYGEAAVIVEDVNLMEM